ncbi:MAG: DUF222 domain-containing protein, partial [Actinomycetota bacterium]|nr:DUF222 domain-containing protein [Actinomycetota bacterium]
MRALTEADALHRAAPTGRTADAAALLALAERVRALALRELAELELTGGHLAAGAPTTAVWLRDTRLLSDATARATVRLAARLRDDLPALARVLQRGDTTVEHVRAVLTETAGLDRATVRDAEDGLWLWCRPPTPPPSAPPSRNAPTRSAPTSPGRPPDAPTTAAASTPTTCLAPRSA